MGRPRPAIVISLLAVVVALGGTAYAASQIGTKQIKNNSIKSADLKNNAGVTGADVKNSSLGSADVADGSLSGADVADDSLTGADVSEAGLLATRLDAQLGSQGPQALSSSLSYIPTQNTQFAQPAGESQQYIAGGRVTFAPSCVQPRSATLYLLMDDPTLAPGSILGLAQVYDTGAGAVSKEFTFSVLPGGGASLHSFKTGEARTHQFFFYGAASCNSGNGVTLDSLGADVIGDR